MSIEYEHAEVLKKYAILKQRDGVTHTDLQSIDELVAQWNGAYNDEDQYTIKDLENMLGEIDSTIDDINMDLDYNEVSE